MSPSLPQSSQKLKEIICLLLTIINDASPAPRQEANNRRGEREKEEKN
jgi:hypothetical protein